MLKHTWGNRLNQIGRIPALIGSLLLVVANATFAQYTTSISQVIPPTGMPVGAGETVSYSLTWTSSPSGQPPPQFILNPAAPLAFVGVDSASGNWSCIAGSPIVCIPGMPSTQTRLNVIFRMPATVPGFNPNDSGSPTRANITISASPATGCGAAGGNGCTPAGTGSNATSVYTVETDYALNMPSSVNSATNQFDLPITIANAGPYKRYEGANVVITLANGMTFLSKSGDSDWSCAGTNPSINCTRINGADQGQGPEVFSLRLQAVNSASVSARVSALTPDLLQGNNLKTTEVSISPPASVDLSLSASAPTASVSQRTESVAFRITSPAGIEPAANVSLTIGQTGAQLAEILTITSPPELTCLIASNSRSATCEALSGLPPGGVTRTVNISARMPLVAFGSAAIVNFNGSLSASNDANSANNFAQARIEISPPASPLRLTLQKTSSQTQVPAGAEFSYNLRVVNVSNRPAPTLQLVDVLPAALSLINANSTTGLNCSAQAQTVTCVINELAVGEFTEATLRVRAPTTAGEIINTASVTATGFEPASASATVSVLAATADLAIDKSDSADPVVASGLFSYTLSARNLATTAATGVVITDALPAGVRLISSSGDGWQCSGSTSISCSRAELAAGQASSVQVNVQAPAAAGLLSNTASVSSAGIDANSANNSDTETTQINAVPLGADLVATASTGGSINPGRDSTVNFTIRNAGPETAANATANITVSGQLSLVSLTGANCSLSGNSASCALGALAPQQSINVSAVVRGLVVGSGEISIAAISSTSDPIPSNNAARTALNIVDVPGVDLNVLLRDSVDPVDLNTDFDYIATINNAGPGAAEASQVSFALASGLTFKSAVGATCNAALVCSLGTIAPGASVTVTIKVSATGEVGRLETSASVSSTARESNPANNTARESTNVRGPGAVALEAIITPSITDRFARDAAPVISEVCANPTADLAAQCETIIDAALDRDIATLEQGLRALYPEEVLSQRLAMVQQSSVQFTNVDARLSELRTGGGGFNVSGLNLRSGNTQVPMNLVQMLTQDSEEPEVGESGDLISPWGFFINGTIARGEQKIAGDTRGVASDFDTTNVTAGVDYRLSARGVVGAALGFAQFDSEVSDNGGSENKATSLTAYGSYYVSDRMYVDSRLTLGRADFDLLRQIQVGNSRRTALGQTDATQQALAFGAGYHFASAGWTITPNFGLRLFRSTIDAFTETGAGDNNIAFDEQDVRSTQYSLGMQVSRAISLSHGVLAPQFDLSMTRETQNDDFGLGARFANVTTTRSFRVIADQTDKSFGNVGLGFVYVTANGKQAYVSYRRLLGNDSIDRDSINLGARFEF